MAFEPSPHIGMLVSPVVIDDQMDRDLTEKLLIESPQEPQKLLMPMPLIALAYYLSLQQAATTATSAWAAPLPAA